MMSSPQRASAYDMDLGGLFSPYRLGELELRSRIVMAPMTRSRALNGNVANPLAATYYAQRASAGLIVTEGTQVSAQGVGFVRTPGIHTPEQVAGWKHVTDTVHAAGGVIFAQLWHVGRASHPEFHDGALPVAPSAIGGDGDVFTSHGPAKMVVPRALETDELPGIVEQFKHGAEMAKRAGFDGVEIHGANGYLLDQFLRDGTNHRTDAYGGEIRNRARLPLEVAEAVISVWGSGRVGYRVSPNSAYNSMSDSNPAETFTFLARQLSGLRIGYMHVTESISGAQAVPPAKRLAPALRLAFEGTFIVNGGYEAATAKAAIGNGEADLVAFGISFLANPDLPERLRAAAPLNAPDVATLYGGDANGYVDYPALAA